MRFPRLKAGDVVTVRFARRLFPACEVLQIMSDYRVKVRIAHPSSDMDPFTEVIERADVICYANRQADRA